MDKVKKLTKRDIEDILALTPMQEGMLFHYLNNPSGDQYFEQLSLILSGEIDIHRFETAWNIVIETNPVLRTVFRWEKTDMPVQVILKHYVLKPVQHDFSGDALSPRQQQQLVEEARSKDRENSFDLRDVPFRVTLCKLQPDEYCMLVSNHHILYDGWSGGIILNEFFEAYRTCKTRQNTF